MKHRCRRSGPASGHQLAVMWCWYRARSVPITSTFKDVLGLDTVTIGFGLPGSQVHAPNEWFREADFDRARTVYAAYLGAF